MTKSKFGVWCWIGGWVAGICVQAFSAPLWLCFLICCAAGFGIGFCADRC